MRACCAACAPTARCYGACRGSARCSWRGPGIQPVDLNPVKVYAAGQGAPALDALIIIKAPDGRTTS